MPSTHLLLNLYTVIQKLQLHVVLYKINQIHQLLALVVYADLVTFFFPWSLILSWTLCTFLSFFLLSWQCFKLENVNTRKQQLELFVMTLWSLWNWRYECHLNVTRVLLDKIPHTARSDLTVFRQHRVMLAQKIQPAKVAWNQLASEGFKTNFEGANINKRD